MEKRADREDEKDGCNNNNKKKKKKKDKCAIRARAKQYRVQDGQLRRVICTNTKKGDALSLCIKDAKTRKQIFNGCHIGPDTKAATECLRRLFLAMVIKGCEKLVKYIYLAL